MTVTQKQLKNLIQNSERTPEERRALARKAGIASGKARNWKAEMQKQVSANWNTEVPGKEMQDNLKKANLPPTYFGQFLFNFTQRAHKNPLMLRALLEVMDVLSPNQNNVTVNATPIIIGGEENLE